MILLKKFYFSIFLTIILTLVALKVSYDMHERILSQQWDSYTKSKEIEINQVSYKMNLLFRSLYESARTISLLPGVRTLNDKRSKLDTNSRAAIQEIYNNAYENSRLSEIYILPKELDPDNKSKGKKPTGPIMTFDEYIVGKSGEQLNQKIEVSHNEKEELEEVEIYEYREMKKQLDYFSKNYPSNYAIKNLEIPIDVSKEVVTCDNSDFTKDQLQAGNDTERLGFILTVPRYGYDHLFLGGVSVVVRSKYIKNILPSKHFALVNFEHELFFGSKSFAYWKGIQKLIHSPKSKEKYQSHYQKNININLADKSELKLLVSYSQHEFFESKSVVFVKRTFYFIYIGILVTSILMMILSWHTYQFENSLEEKVTERTDELNNTLNQLRDSQEQLIQSSKLASLGEMAGGIAHEVNNPVAVIYGLSQRSLAEVEKKSPDLELIKKSFKKIEKMTIRISKIIDGLRTFSRKEAQSEKELVCLKDVLEETIDLSSIKLKKSYCEIILDIDENIELFCQPISLSQVFLNLIGNAIDALEPQSEKWIKISTNIKEENLEIRFLDSGTEMTPELASKLFDPFYTSKEVGKGTGLGLSISKSIVDHHNGEIYIDLESKNTCFVVSLPLKDSKEKQSPAA